ncbi:undecaprenyl/decaprenyl-phosphate alpha-N-acetylglucosaminyl 1-phosphate transferase [Prochlorococcus sp. AH-736-J10]|nr:undecaprenyl/decaprenyl-phosphate alpha-N-acetylglucosaminyl 1-phosphate transferase [Prochlorococcus sp. AH-736-J10]
MELVKYNIITAFCCLFISTFYCLILTPFLIRFGRRFNFLDYPNDRKKHKKEVVNIGGISILVGIFSVVNLAYILMKLDKVIIFNDLYLIIPILFFTNLIIFTTGFYDDKYSLSPSLRLVIQLSSSSLMWIMGLRIDLIDFSFLNSNYLPIQIPTILSYLITVIWIAGIVNAINWLDGMDGLAAGVCLLISFGMMIMAFYIENNLAIIFSSSIVGSCIGFLTYNFTPAKIIMGDAGSNLLGFNLALTSIILLRDSHSVGILPFSFIIFSVPIFDMLKVIFLRLKKGLSPFHPDRNHLHFQLLRRNLSEKKVIIFIYILVFLSLSISLLTFDLNLALSLLITSLIGLIIFVYKYIFRKSKY